MKRQRQLPAGAGHMTSVETFFAHSGLGDLHVEPTRLDAALISYFDCKLHGGQACQPRSALGDCNTAPQTLPRLTERSVCVCLPQAPVP